MRKVYLIGVAGIVVALCLACGSSGSGEDASAGPTGNATATATAPAGQAARDGKFEFTIQQIRCGVASVGTNPVKNTANGQFCLITLNIKNIGTDSQLFTDIGQRAVGADNVKYSSDTVAGVQVNKDANAFAKEIAPGNSITAVLVFDVPKTATITKLELHDSPLSDGVTLSVH